ncbi:MAG: hypothetical protein JWP81_1074 [Ferruginibacter sp.]|nr:hypothetical protein [Ferruginibacter sp.]
MKRYLFGIIAVIIATASVAFTSSHSVTKPLTSHNFYYVAPSGLYTELAVENKANWISNPGTIPTCSGSAKACTIAVNDNYTELNGSGVRVFKTSGNIANIVAEEGTSQDLFVPIVLSSTGLDSKADRPQ